MPADATLTFLHPELFHGTCVAHLLHNCAMKVKFHFEDVDQLFESQISKLKTKPDKPNSLLLVAGLSLLLHDGEAG